ncbi:hypothetical protein FIV42_27110 [Persicimonas caeni]|uniref:Tetratricopeptide repeat protein n=1 Tax=Persicimonas caeni TaxID=2292766 RepID=A0A4Y6Q127_PERCE|nr:hypothetical protein [Persicimonas caeni]QDG54281.1 hypothetical protein FIV42_27110 [Persicimonas caeni]QED35502.1 hypothetical protein FRD00_27105 [Persicimonas caeni]
MSPHRRKPDVEASTRATRLAIPDHALAALEYQARRHYRRWWLDEAERLARMVVRFDVGRPGAWFVLGDIEMRRMNWERAFGHFQQAVDCRRGDSMAWCRGAEALYRMGELERAEDWARHAVSLEPPGGNPGAKRAKRFLNRHRADFEKSRLQEADASAAPTQKLEAFTTRPQPEHPANIHSLEDYRSTSAE